MSVEEPTEILMSRIRNTTDQLMKIWDEVHMDQTSREARIKCAYSHFNILLNDILKALDKDLTALKQRKAKIIESQMEVYQEYEAFCTRTDTKLIEIKGIDENIIPGEKLEELRSKCLSMKAVLEERLEQVIAFQAECKKIQDVLSTHCNLTREEILMLNGDFTERSVISEALVQKFSFLEQKLKDQYDEWIEEVVFRYDELLVKMTDLSKKCFNANNDHIKYPMGFDPKNIGECEVQQMEEEIKLLEEKYERGKPVFDKLNEWMGFWREKLDAERRVCRTSFYKNRGGALTASLKRQKQVCQQVPKVFAELTEIVDSYVKNYNAEDILVEGMLPHKYAEYIMEDYQRDREMQKSQKQFTKKPKGKENFAGGKSMIRSVFKTSDDLISPTTSNTRTNLSTRKRSFSCSQISLISPTKPPLPIGFPMTSSPKIRRLSPLSSSNNNEQKTPHTSSARIGLKPGTSGIKPVSVRKLPANTTRTITPSRPWY